MSRILTIQELNTLNEKIKGLRAITNTKLQSIPGLFASRDENAAHSVEDSANALRVMINILEKEIDGARCVIPKKQNEKVFMGNAILMSIDGDKPSKFIMSDLIERDDEKMAISSSSPVGRILLGKGVGRYNIILPKKNMEVEIYEIFFPEEE